MRNAPPTITVLALWGGTVLTRRSLAMAFAISLAASLLAVAPLAGESSATTVNNVATESDYRNALAALSSDGDGPHSITITGGFTITDPEEAGDPIYTGAQGLTINGNGHTIDSDVGINTRFLAVVDSDADLTIENLTVEGFQHGGDGGAVRAAGDLTIANSTLRDNTAEVAVFLGTTFPSSGGAVFADGDVTIANSTLNGNTAMANGGAVLADGDLTIQQSTLSGNSARGEGGAVRASGAVTIENTTLSDNTAGAVGTIAGLGSGGAVHADGAVTIRDNSTLTGNAAAPNGGAVRARGVVNIRNSTLSDNTAAGVLSLTGFVGGKGGAVHADGPIGAVSIVASTLSGNTAHEGGAVSAVGHVSMTNSTLNDNSAVGDLLLGGGFGGAVRAPTASTANVILDGNHATQGGGAVDAETRVDILGSTLSSNSVSGAFGAGGAVRTSDIGDVVIWYSTLNDNSVSGAFGAGGAVMAEEGAVHLVNSTLTYNSTEGDGTGGGAVHAGGDVTLNYATTASNVAEVGSNISTFGDLTSFGSVLADPQGGANCDIGNTTLSTYSYEEGDDSCGFTGTGDTSDGSDPLLGPLADNGGLVGGLTETRMPEAASPLINAIPAGACGPPDPGLDDIEDDQRRVVRPQGVGCDIGAVEVEDPFELTVGDGVVTVDEGSLAANAGTVSGGVEPIALTASVGDVTQGVDGTWSWSHTPAKGPRDSQTVTLTATDDDGQVTTIDFALVVANVAPTVTLTGPSSADEGDTKSYTYTISDPGVNDTHDFTAGYPDCGDHGDLVGTPGIDDGSFDCTFPDGPKNSTVAVQVVDDDDGVSNGATIEVTVHNVAPAVVIDELVNESGTESLLVGLTAELAASFADPGSLDSHTATVDWGDGTAPTTIDPATSPVQDSHVYVAAGVFTVQVMVTDNDGDTDTASVDVTVLEPSDGAAEAAQDLKEHLEDPNLDPAASEAIGNALDELEGQNDGNASNGAVDQLEKGNLNAALVKIKKAIEYLEAAEAADASLDLSETKAALALTAKSVAVGVIEEAEAAAVSPNEQDKVDQAKDLVADGDALLASGDFVGAVAKYQEALRKVRGVSA